MGKEDLFWLTVSEVLVHGHLAPLPLGHWHSSSSRFKYRVEQSCSSRGRWEAGRERKVQGPNIPFQGMSPVTKFLQKAPPLKGCTDNTMSWDQTFNTRAFGGHPLEHSRCLGDRFFLDTHRKQGSDVLPLPQFSSSS